MKAEVMVQVEKGLQATYKYEGDNIQVSEIGSTICIRVDDKLEGVFNTNNFISYDVIEEKEQPSNLGNVGDVKIPDWKLANGKETKTMVLDVELELDGKIKQVGPARIKEECNCLKDSQGYKIPKYQKQ